MKAYVLQEINHFEYQEVVEPELGENEVLVSVKAAGICGSDIPRVYKTGTYTYPLIPGHEFAGNIVSVGKNVCNDWIGKRVGIFPLIPCGKCMSCVDEKYETCKKYSYLGSRTNGGFAEYVKVPVWNLVRLYDEISYEQAAMLEPMAVAVHAMRKINIKESDTIVVCGLGTIGLLLVMFLIEQGSREILVVGNKDFQKEKTVEMGICESNFCDVRYQNVSEWINDKTNLIGANVFFECVGKNETFSMGINCTASNGTVCIVGNPTSDMKIDKESYWKILRNQLTVCGTWNSSFKHSEEDDWHYVLEKLRTGNIHPENLITHKFKMNKLIEGFEIMKDKSEEYIKIIGVREGE